MPGAGRLSWSSHTSPSAAYSDRACWLRQISTHTRRPGLTGAKLHVAVIVGHRAGLIAIVTAGDGENGNVDFLVIVRSGSQRIEISIRHRMREPFLKHGGRIADQNVESFKREMLAIDFAPFRVPEGVLTEEFAVAGDAASEREPLHQIQRADVGVVWKIHAGMGSRRRHDGGDVSREV